MTFEWKHVWFLGWSEADWSGVCSPACQGRRFSSVYLLFLSHTHMSSPEARGNSRDESPSVSEACRADRLTLSATRERWLTRSACQEQSGALLLHKQGSFDGGARPTSVTCSLLTPNADFVCVCAVLLEDWTNSSSGFAAGGSSGLLACTSGGGGDTEGLEVRRRRKSSGKAFTCRPQRPPSVRSARPAELQGPFSEMNELPSKQARC